MNFTIDRTHWFRGEGGNFSRLLLPNGFMCCLGHFGKACGIQSQDLLSTATPVGVAEKLDGLNIEMPLDFSFLLETDVQSGKIRNSKISMALVGANDDPDIHPEDRESRISELFAKHGHIVEFIN